MAKQVFSVAVPAIWHLLPVTIKSSETITTFHKNIFVWNCISTIIVWQSEAFLGALREIDSPSYNDSCRHSKMQHTFRKPGICFSMSSTSDEKFQHKRISIHWTEKSKYSSEQFHRYSEEIFLFKKTIKVNIDNLKVT